MTSPAPDRLVTAQRSDHSDLRRRLLWRPSGQPRGGQLDAVVVPAARRAHRLRGLLQLTAQHGILLVVIASHDCSVDEVAALVARTPGGHALLIELPEGHENDLLSLATSAPRFRKLSPARTSNLSRKRNLGLLLARLRGWRKIMFLDDDIRWVTPEHLARVAHHLESNQFAGLRTVNFPDNSVVCHARRLSGLPQGVFVSGAALGVNVAKPLEVFPDVYNEDWFSFSGEAATAGIAHVGDIGQLEFNPFDDPARAVREEFGDLLAEGLYALFSQGGALGRATVEYWNTFKGQRARLIAQVRQRLEDREPTFESVQAQASLDSAKKQLEEISADDCVDFIDAWQEDRKSFSTRFTELTSPRSYAESSDLLGLPPFREVSFGEPRKLDPLSFGQPNSLSRSRSSMRPVPSMG